jgi:hypothetical protein
MRRVLFILTVLALALPSAASAGLARPTPTTPASGAVTPWVPAFGWKAVAGADHYLFQMAADPNFNSPVETSGDSIVTTRNTFASWKFAIPNGNYYWHVRAVDAKGNLGPWSAALRFNKHWVGTTTPLSPANNSTLAYPSNPTMKWKAVDGAAKYEFTLASDPDLSSLDGQPAKPVETDSNEFTYTAGLSAGTTYYWSVTPIDGEGNRGFASAPFHFKWQWNSGTTLAVVDLAPAPDVVDPRFSWTPIPNAARYDVEINSDASFAAGSKFCCTTPTVGTVMTPTNVLLNNQYYWRVRGIDADGNFGIWNYYSDPLTGNPFFRKTFDTRDPGDLNPSIQNLRMADNISGVADPNTPGNDADAAPGYQTQVPIVTWDPVLGASAYEVEVRLFTGGGCTTAVNAEYWDSIVATNAWTPLGPNPVDEPWPNHGRNLAHDGSRNLVAGHDYCVRVRAFTDQGYDQNHLLKNVVGDWSYIDNGNDQTGNEKVAFGFLGYPDDPQCTDIQPFPTCSADHVTANDYSGAPMFGETTDHTPVFTWSPTAKAQGYFVLVSRDPNFTTVVDYAWTREPAYAPRFGNNATTYADETTAYYWVVMPAAYTTGLNARIDPTQEHGGSVLPPDFTKEGNVPTLLHPVPPDHAAVLRPTFEWTMVDWARNYTVQVATDPTFSNLVETITTASTSYTPQGNYPAGPTLYWRVRVNDWNHIALTWSPSSTFSVTIGKPGILTTNPTAGQLPPTWSWSPVQGALNYDVEIQYPDGRKTLFKGYRSSAVTLIKLDGSGLWHWKVRANFPTKNPTQLVQGPWTNPLDRYSTFRNSMPSPIGTITNTANGGLLFSWLPRAGAAHYKVQVSQRADFGGTSLESLKVDSPVYAPVLTSPQYIKGGNLYWRVASVDEIGNIGEFSPSRSIYLPQQLKVSVLGVLRRKKSGKLVITVLDPKRNGVRGAKIVITGAGLRRKTVRTNSAGKVTVTLKPRKRGTIRIAVSKSGSPAFRSTSVTTTVR